MIQYQIFITFSEVGIFWKRKNKNEKYIKEKAEYKKNPKKIIIIINVCSFSW